MEHMYSAFCASSRESNTQRFAEWLCDNKCLTSVSSSNLLAFTSLTDLKEIEPKTQSINVYVIDLNIPNTPHLVTTHTEDITALEWDTVGSKLLIGDSLGTVYIWSMKNHLINDWHLFYSHSAFFGERILAASWFHNGNKLGINAEKKDLILPYTDKFTTMKFSPSVRQFGGKPASGCLCISSSGLVSCLVLLSDGSCVTGEETLGHFRAKLKVIDICYAKNGDFLVVTSNGSINSSINCYRVAVKICNSHEKNKCTITCQPFSSFYLECSTIEGNKLITHLKFVLKEAAEAVVVAVSGIMGSTVELWELREKPVSLHKMFQMKGNEFAALQSKTCIVWQHHASINHNHGVVAIATPRLSLFDVNPPLSYIVVAFRDNIIKCYYRENLQQVCSVNMSPVNPVETTKSFNLHKTSSTANVTSIVDMQFTYSGCALIAMDTASQIFVYRMSPITDPGNAFSASSIQTLLEYCLITGNDWWDIILSLRPNIIENVCDKLSEGFLQKQPSGVQQKWMSRFLAIKASLYRCLNIGNTGQVKSGDCYALIMLNAISNLLKSLLRVRDNQEKDGPAETLSALMQSRNNEAQYMNLNKVLLCLEHKEFLVEIQILQSLQHLNQWVGDTTLFLLASLPQQIHNHYLFPGGGLIFDAKSVNTLRELLVLIRIWGLLNEKCLPVFTKLTSDDADVIELLFKLLTKTVLSIGSEPDESLLDECCLLPNQVLIPQLDFTLKAIGVASPALFTNPHPLTFEYYNEAPFLKYNVKSFTLNGAVMCNTGCKIDAVRHISLGNLCNESSNVRSCTRCVAVSLIQSIYKSPAHGITSRAWDQRWFKNCICGGNWKLGLP
ncbi:mediator of RNA polymerase II transcription subunit 16-like protein [Dinothrombium tinctorium]|uniref:Mediator of RNA polymerase II transcription subunit 16 n=1 Tax=Dinothrombium tinctorium TaxID=1965070 RepID=A0A3S3P2M1_9ACAR|nr:mediator of RNA polymerase II transcription subunit 16-like protein [Dinothrombium tinctorium]